MARGRKRKAGARKPSGRLAQPGRVETDWLAMEPVLRRRCREVGIKPTVDNMRAVRGHEGGTPWGQLYLRQVITRQQCEAMTAFANLRADWLQSIDAPVQRGSDMDPDHRGASLVAENVARVRAIRVAYAAADRALRDAGVRPMRAVFRLLEGETPDIGLLRAGLDALDKVR